MHRQAVFVCGSSWSGSSAVTDWLNNSGAFVKFPGQEVKAVSQGLLRLQQLHNERRWIGYRHAKRVMCADGDAEYVSGIGYVSSIQDALDRLYTWLYSNVKVWARSQGPEVYRKKLTRALARDVEDDKVYQGILRSTSDLLTAAGNRGVDLSLQANELLGHLHDIWSAQGVPLFDNTFPRSAVRWLPSATSSFDRCAIILVTRDPIDQYAEIKHARFLPLLPIKTFSRVHAEFKRAARNLSLVSGESRLVRIVDFSSFVTDEGGVRTRLSKDICGYLDVENNLEPAAGPCFDPLESAQNIGKHLACLSARERAKLARLCIRESG